MKGHAAGFLRVSVAAALMAVLLAGCNIPTADFTMAPEEGTAPLAVQFTDASTVISGAINAWAWEFGDGGTSALQNPQHTYEDPGTYTAKLTVTTTKNRSASKTATVTVNSAEGENEGEEEGEKLDDLLLAGWIREVSGDMVPNVNVSVVGTDAAAQSDAVGLYRFYKGDFSGTDIVVKFEKEGYTPAAVAATLLPEGEATFVNVTLKVLAEPEVLDSDAGGEVADDDGNKIEVPAGAFVRKDNGKAVSGDVDVQITPLDVTDPEDLAAFPGEFRAAAGKADGDTVQLETFALADFTVTQDGAPLDLAPNKSGEVYIEIVLPADTTLTSGEEVPLWSFDEETGLWIEEGTGEVITNKAGELVYRAGITHLSWWNADKALSETQCVTGVAEDEDGDPLAYAKVVAEGISYNGSSFAQAKGDGTFCVDVKRGSTVQLNLYLPGGTMVVGVKQVTVPNTSASCNTGDCVELTEPLQAGVNACVTGEVREEDGDPLAGATVYSSLGGTAVTDSEGWFCMNTPADAYASFFVSGRPPVSVTTSVDGTSCETGGCSHVLITIKYPKDGDHVGVIAAYLISQDKIAGDEMFTSSAVFVMRAEEDEGGSPQEQQLDFDFEEGCTVFTNDSSNSEGEPGEGESPEEGEVEYAVAYLDPGTPGEVSSGAESAFMYRMSDLYPIYFPSFYSIFTLDFMAEVSFSGGSDLTYSWPGGTDIGPFTGVVSLPETPVISAPVFPDPLELGDIPPWNVPLNVVWIPSGAAFAMIHLTATADMMEEPFDTRTGAIICMVEDTGTYTITTDLLEQLPAPTINEKYTLNLTVRLSDYDDIEVPLVHGGMGTVTAFASSQYGEESIYEPPDEGKK